MIDQKCTYEKVPTPPHLDKIQKKQQFFLRRPSFSYIICTCITFIICMTCITELLEHFVSMLIEQPVIIVVLMNS